jgi:predicted DnaQ family exonuclease/DinG family helicase
MNLRAELLKELGLSTFVVVDLETTGLIPGADRIIEIGAIKYTDGEESARFEKLINPQIPIPDFISRLTGINDSQVENAPLINEVFGELDAFLHDLPFVGHQVNFDASFIEYIYREQNKDFENWDNPALRFKYFGRVRIDTLFLARIMLPFLPKHKLTFLSNFFGHNLENAHRAVDDAHATAHVFLELLDRALLLDNNIISEIINLLFANSVRAKSFFVPLLKFKKENNITAPAVSILDDIKYAQSFYNVIGEKEYLADAREEDDFTPVDPQKVKMVFGDNGVLAQVIEKYELREEQVNMALQISNSLNENAIIIAEAGTGTGKSMAYLLPAIEWAVKNRAMNERIVVSTNTKNLQEQLFYKDLPTLFQAQKGNFKAVLLKGRSNYLCIDKWRTIMTDMNQRLSQDERARVLPLVLWARQTRTGDISENPAFQLENNIGLWQKFIAEPSYCPGKSCKFYKDCHLMRARDQARRADLVIVNHALLFSDLASDHSILGEFHNLVIDEAHNIEKTAAEHLGTRVSYWTFRNIYHRLYEEDPKKTGAILQLEFRLSKSHRLENNEVDDIFKHVNKIKKNSTVLKLNVQQFYSDFNQYMRAKAAGNTGNEYQKIRYFSNFKFFRENDDKVAEINQNLAVLAKELNSLINVIANLPNEKFEFQDQIHRELLALEQDIIDLNRAFDFCIKADEKKYVFWLDVPFSERNIDVLMYAVPLHIAEILQERLFKELRSAVLTSATLSVDKTFQYFKTRIGLNLLKDKEIHSSIHGSPFNYEQQLFLAVTDFLPDPRNQEFSAGLINLIKEIHSGENRGLMVLFTSYSMLNMVYNALKPHFDSERILLLAQGKNGSRTNIINQFRENKDSVLLGTDSFWEGVDIPGDALQILMIPKLPFDVPTEPIIAARMEEIKNQGGNPFFDYSVPEAIIKFRQGFGRLIRSKSDYGAVICCDNRLSRMQYGRQFLNSLPVKGNIYFKKEELLDDLHNWFLEKTPVS